MNNENEVEIDVPEENTTAGLPLAAKTPEFQQTGRELLALNPGNDSPPPPITAKQAKIEAIADLTHSAYQKAATLVLTKEETEALKKDFPDEAFRPGAAGKENLIYIEHPFLRERFSEVFGLGGWAIITRRTWNERFELPPNRDRKEPVEVIKVYVEAMLVVRGCFVAEAIGDMDYYPKNMSTNYGDAVEGAKTAAFRRCAKEFGVGLQAWKKEWCQGWMDRKMHPGKRVYPRPTPTVATTPQPKAESKLEKFLSEATKVATLQQVQAFLIDLAWLMPNEELAKLEERYLPKTVGDMKSFKSCLENWLAHGATVQPYDCPIPDPAAKKEEGDEASEQPWYNVIVPIPRKGLKRDEYMQKPDTIGSLYEARKDNEDARKRLWGLRKGGEECNWVPKPREYNGKTYQPSEADKKFYAAMKEFAAWHDNHHGE